MQKNRAKSFVVIMISIALSALVLRTLVSKVIRLTSARNESNAQTTLKLISAAIENYAKDNHGLYPDKISLLTQPNPPYLDKDYIKQSPLRGYNYNCSRFNASGYSCSALPTRCRLTGKIAFNISTGNLLISEDCDKK